MWIRKIAQAYGRLSASNDSSTLRLAFEPLSTISKRPQAFYEHEGGLKISWTCDSIEDQNGVKGHRTRAFISVVWIFQKRCQLE